MNRRSDIGSYVGMVVCMNSRGCGLVSHGGVSSVKLPVLEVRGIQWIVFVAKYALANGQRARICDMSDCEL